MRLVDGVERLSERVAVSQIERDRHRRELALVIDRERLADRLEVREGTERHWVGAGHAPALLVPPPPPPPPAAPGAGVEPVPERVVPLVAVFVLEEMLPAAAGSG